MDPLCNECLLYPAGWDVAAEVCCNLTCVTLLHLNLNKDSVLLHYIGHTLVLVMQSLTRGHHLWLQAPHHHRICRWGIKFPFITLFPWWESSLRVDHELFPGNDFCPLVSHFLLCYFNFICALSTQCAGLSTSDSMSSLLCRETTMGYHCSTSSRVLETQGADLCILLCTKFLCGFLHDYLQLGSWSSQWE